MVTETAWLPPVPIFQEIEDSWKFLLHSVDDAAEDTVKVFAFGSLACLFFPYVRRWVWMRLLHILHWGQLRSDANSSHGTSIGSSATNKAMRLSAFLIWLILLHPGIDTVADSFGDIVGNTRNICVESLGYEVKESHSAHGVGSLPPMTLRNSILGLVDDLAEDSFKVVCIGSHVYVGQLINSVLQATGPAGSVAGMIVAIGAPVGRYRECDMYADQLGDVVQQLAAMLMRIDP